MSSAMLFLIQLWFFKFILLLDYTASNISATRRLVWVVHSTIQKWLESSIQLRIKCEKIFLEKAFEAIMEMDNLYSVIVEDVVAETNDFLKHLHCGWRNLTFLML